MKKYILTIGLAFIYISAFTQLNDESEYTKTQLQTNGNASVNFNNITHARDSIAAQIQDSLDDLHINMVPCTGADTIVVIDQGEIKYETTTVNLKGYAISGSTAALNLSDASTYYPNYSASGTPNYIRINIPKAGTVKAIIYTWYAATVAGSNENMPLQIRLNNTTDYAIETIGSTDVQKIFDNYNMTIPVVAGDYLDFKLVTPTWTTNPTGVYCTWSIYIE